MPILFITPQEIAQTTVMGGNVDVDKYNFIIESVQEGVIHSLLGTELYEKIVTEVGDLSISGLYLEMYTKFIKPITKNEALAEYIEVASLIVANGGIYKHAPENGESATEGEINALKEKYHQLSQKYINRFDKWICKNDIPEYKRYQDEVNATKLTTRGGWYFGSSRSSGTYNDNLQCWLKSDEWQIAGTNLNAKKAQEVLKKFTYVIL